MNSIFYADLANVIKKMSPKDIETVTSNMKKIVYCFSEGELDWNCLLYRKTEDDIRSLWSEIISTLGRYDRKIARAGWRVYTLELDHISVLYNALIEVYGDEKLDISK